jgi:hypothetical protein
VFPPVDIDLPGIGPVSVVFAPVVGIIYADVDARVKIPVTVNVNIPAINVNFDIDFNVDLSDPTADPEPNPETPDKNPDGRPEQPDCPLPEDCDDEPEETDEDEPDEDLEDAKGTGILSVIVLSVRNGQTTRATQISQDTAPSIWAPAIGFVNFVYERLDGNEVFGADIPVKNVNTVIPAPCTGLRCKRVVGTPNQGFDFELITLTGPRSCR